MGKKLNVEIELIHQDDDVFYEAYCEEINCVGHGDTLKEALINFEKEIEIMKRVLENKNSYNRLASDSEKILSIIKKFKEEKF